jgi:hypothetical protein
MKFVKYLTLLVCVLLTSCEEYHYSKFKPISVENSNVAFTSLDNGFLLQTTVPSASANVSFAPKYKSKRLPFITSVVVNGVTVSDSDLVIDDGAYQEKQAVLTAEWGTIYYDCTEGDLFVQVQLNRNISQTDKNVKLQLGFGYEYVVVEITQLGDNGAF